MDVTENTCTADFYEFEQLLSAEGTGRDSTRCASS